jgi:hypothetical protein
MMWITPLDASVPYSVAAAGPLMISMLSMSSGLKSLIREITLELNACTLGPVDCALSARTPSTTRSGWFASEKLLEPRIRICDPEPTMPVPGVMTTPGARALIRLCTFDDVREFHRLRRTHLCHHVADGAPLRAPGRARDYDLVQLDGGLSPGDANVHVAHADSALRGAVAQQRDAQRDLGAAQPDELETTVGVRDHAAIRTHHLHGRTGHRPQRPLRFNHSANGPFLRMEFEGDRRQ